MSDAPLRTAATPAEGALTELFGARMTHARDYAHLLATDGVERGLIGPREVPRLWDRHLGNCAVLAPLLPAGGSVADVGSGAGLPGLVLAIARPDIRVTLIEPLLRRTTFLLEAVAALALTNVVVHRARAENVDERFDVVASRAVAPLTRLATWCVPLLRDTGAVLAIKGASAGTELAGAEDHLRHLGARSWDILVVGTGLLSVPTTVVRIEGSTGGRSRSGGRARPGPRASSRGSRTATT